MSIKEIHNNVHLKIQQYHLSKFKLDHLELFTSLTQERIEEMRAYVKMWEDLVEIIKNVEGIDYIDLYLYHHEQFQNYCSPSNYYYRRNKLDNILWKYLYDC